jgi:hypothetical protein
MLTRRSFAAGSVAALAAAPDYRLRTYCLRSAGEAARVREDLRRLADAPCMILDAIAAAHLPQVVAVFGPRFPAPHDTQPCIYELRVYDAPVRRWAGVHPILSFVTGDGFACLTPFASLAAREKAWRELSGVHGRFPNVTGITLLRAAERFIIEDPRHIT